jgi:hypothetical protein
MITTTPNYSARTFTIRKGTESKYRTNKMSKIEFEENLMNTEKDWQNFLNVSQDYYLVK